MKKDRYPWLLLSVTSLGVLLTTLNLSTLNVALPEVAAYFHAGAVATSWILLSYMLFNTILILVFGKLADIYGRRTLYLIGLTEFTVVSLLCGFSENVWVLIGLRILQAAGGALVITNTTPLITDAFPQRDLGTALGINVLNASVAQLAGPVVGGYLVYAFGWRWVFWFNVPIGIIGILWAIYTLRPVPGQAKGEKIDFPGNAFILLGLGGLIFAFSEGGVIGWSSGLVLGGMALFVLFAACFVWWERHAPYPTVDLTLFRDRSYAMANLATFLNSLARSSVVLLVALFFQVVSRENTFDAGLKVLPVTVGMIIASPVAGALSARFSARLLSTGGLGVTCVGMLLLMENLGLNASVLRIELGQLLVGIGTGLFMTPNTKSIMLTVPLEKRGMANGLRSMLQNMGAVISAALSLMIVTSALPARLKDAIYEGAGAAVSTADIPLIAGGYRLAFLVLLLLTVLAIAASFLRPSAAKTAAKTGSKA
ncbi:MFS transporter [Paenibacillus humicola]|uniref:MFS transporter n=1 Tax=Paenibacillus humicola TaxID=3110540 RepID=UPI00237A53D6|nr:MFS transporter [Paenibacillus humicola]